MSLNLQDFIDHLEKANVSERINNFQLDKKIYSDCLDEHEHQYVDIVMEGGGVLGVALLGYLYVLERVGIRFCSIGGTSAGSITALLLAALDIPEKDKTQRLIELVANMPMADFVDGKNDRDTDAKDFVNTMIKSENLMSLWNIVDGLQVIDNFKEMMGLNRGDVFHNWVKKKLDGMGISDTSLLKKRMGVTPSGWKLRENEFKKQQDFKSLDIENNYLCLVASDVSTESRTLFPEMAGLYWDKPEVVHPSDYVRCSMSIPGFFKPVKIKSTPMSPARQILWSKHLNQATINSKSFPPSFFVFVDGGMISNFPIDVFHNHGAIPTRPTLGIKLQLDILSHEITNGFDLMKCIIETSRHALDYEFIKKNPDFSNLIGFIDTKKINWLNFSMNDATKLLLFQMGADAAINFLNDFSWQEYKEVRKKQLDSGLWKQHLV